MSYFKLINGIKDTLRTDARVITITEGYVDRVDEYKQKYTYHGSYYCRWWNSRRQSKCLRC